MPKPSLIDSLPREQRAAFEQELIRRNFADYDGLVAWAKAFGFEINRSTAHRYGQKIKRKLQAVKDSTEAARMIAEAAPDDKDLRSAAVVSLVQSELFDVMVTLQELEDADPNERVKLLSHAAKALRYTALSSLGQKKWQQEHEARIRAEERQAAALEATQAAKAEGVSEQGISRIRAALGMVA